MLPIPATDKIHILSLSWSLGPLSMGMAFLPSVSISVSAGSPKPNWMHLILVDTHLPEKQARNEDLWKEGSAHGKFLCDPGPLPRGGRVMACTALCNLQG